MASPKDLPGWCLAFRYGKAHPPPSPHWTVHQAWQVLTTDPTLRSKEIGAQRNHRASRVTVPRFPVGRLITPHSSTVAAHHCRGRRLRSEGTGGTATALLGPQLTPLFRRPQLRWPQGCCCAASLSPPPSAGTPAPHVPGNPGHISLQEPPPKGTLWGKTEHF